MMPPFISFFPPVPGGEGERCGSWKGVKQLKEELETKVFFVFFFSFITWNIFNFHEYWVIFWNLWFSGGHRHKTVCRLEDQSVCAHKDRNIHMYFFLAIDKHVNTHQFYTWHLVSIWTHLTVRAAEHFSKYYKLHVMCVISLSAEFLVAGQHQLWHLRAMRKRLPSIMPYHIFCSSGINKIRPCFICGEKACTNVQFHLSCLFL